MAKEFIDREIHFADSAKEFVYGAEHARSVSKDARRTIAPANHDVADTLAKLSEIAGPWVITAELLINPGDNLCAKALDLGGCIMVSGPTRVVASFGQKLIGDEANELRQIVRPIRQLLSKGGRCDLVGAEPVVEVVAEPPGAHLGTQFAVGRGDDLAMKCERLRVS